MSEMADAIHALLTEKGMSEDQIRQTIENAIKAAYKKSFGSADNCIVNISDDMTDVTVYARKTIVDGVYDPSIEIELDEARELTDECEIGDEIDIQIDPHNFERSAVNTGKQKAHQDLNEGFKDSLYNEYKKKLHTIVIGNVQREHNENLYIDLNKQKVEGVLPKRNQNQREHYELKDRIRAFCTEIKRSSDGVQLILSRTAPELVEKILELEVPEIQDGTISVFKVVREAGYRTKVAVYSNRPEVDPVGSCVGQKGARIQNVISELEGEKIDVLKYDEDPHVFIKNALSPAEVSRVVILDAAKREALAIVPDTQFSLAIGKQGQNVRLANRLCDWNIDVKTEEQAADLDLTEVDTRKAAEQLFANEEVEYEEIVSVCQLEAVDKRIADVLKGAGLDDIQQFLDAVDSGAISTVEGLTQEDIDAVTKVINENVEFEDAEAEEAEAQVEAAEQEEEEEYFCPECGAKISLDMTKCPNCGCEFSFEEE